MKDEHRRWWQFRISTILFLTVIVALVVGWGADRRQQYRLHQAEFVEQRRKIVISVIESRVEYLRAELIGTSRVKVRRIVHQMWPEIISKPPPIFDPNGPTVFRGKMHGETIAIGISYDPRSGPEESQFVARVQAYCGERADGVSSFYDEDDRMPPPQ